MSAASVPSTDIARRPPPEAYRQPAFSHIRFDKCREHWVVVRGTAEVTVDGNVTMLTENQSIYPPLGCTHRLVNPGKIELELIGVQTGSYLGEDDIIRIEDESERSWRPAKTVSSGLMLP